ncbi:endonuclease MutS2 [Paraliomyxa miuraensis]|uniref:endonuclease MutS2 n=1 Tax=Paraliomyxa miuraensis TaxID=376150 RepID=UPI0022505415|nr:Smr/MutS family protein [Paraliomyxa miuraensis]MCX4239974.1 Smr/MutS family protein [Paraliomyxa miuraensis]
MSACLQHLEWERLCEHLDALLASPLAQWGEPAWARSTERAEVERWLTEQDGLEAALRWRPEINAGAQLQRVQALSEELSRAARGISLEPAELMAVGELCDALGRLAPLCERPDDAVLAVEDGVTRAGHSALVAALPGLRPHADLAATLLRSIALDGPQGEPVVADGASPALARARAQVRSARQTLAREADRLVRSSTLADALADRFYTEREGRVVLPVRSGSFSRAGGRGTVGGIIHGASTTGHTLYVEPPELMDDNNRLREAQMAARAEERRVLAELSARVGAVAPALHEGLVALERLDRIRARLRLGQALHGHRPQVIEPVVDAEREDFGVELSAARHPLMVLAGTVVVPNDIRVRTGGALIISGPNAGGKTVALKTLGMCVLMAQAGLRLPTDGPARVPLYRSVITDVGDDQSISANLSTFSAHIGHVIEALDRAREDPAGTLVLLDEVAVGTDPEQGAALAEAILRRLTARGATVVATTHYERLKLLAHDFHAQSSSEPGSELGSEPGSELGSEPGPTPGMFANAAVGFDLARLRPTFELRLGVPGSSSAIAVARRLGVEEEVLGQAEAMLSDERLRVDVLLQALEAERVALHEQQQALQTERTALHAREARLQARERKELQEAEALRTRAHDAAARELRQLEDELRRRRKQLRKAPLTPAPEGQVAPTDAEARDFARQAREAVQRGRLPAPPPEGNVPALPQVGDRVFVEGLDAEGEVVAVKGDKVTVQLPLAKTTVDRSALRARRGAPKASPSASAPTMPSDAARHFGADARPVQARFDNVIDLRGERAEDAQDLLEVSLDRAIGEDVEVVLVRHGHGSGALRRAIRERLDQLRHVRVHRPGLPPEGGDAVTVVWVTV